MDHIHFTKASGAGNDFIIINNITGQFSGDPSLLARIACPRRTGIGVDGLILIEKSTKDSFLMKYYNADGSFGGMCGNGGRCASRFAMEEGIAGAEHSFEALGYSYKAIVKKESVVLAMKEPRDFRISMTFENMILHSVNTGSPHVVTFSEDISSLDVEGIGRRIREHDMFKPDGTNVNFVRIDGRGTLSYRTYERGVEAETLSCGTGAIAAALIANKLKGILPPVQLRTRGRDLLYVDFKVDSDNYHSITLEGVAHMLFHGNFLFDPKDKSIQKPT